MKFLLIGPYRVCLSIAFCLLSACASHNQTSTPLVDTEAAWLNPLMFGEKVKTDGYLSNVQFTIEFTGQDKKPFTAKECSLVLNSGDGAVVEREYHRWQWLKDNCIAANKFFDAPKSAKSHWPKAFDFDLIKRFPASAIPYLGGQGLDGRTGTLSAYDASLTLVEAPNQNHVSVEVDNLEVYYVQVARADFNRDGIQDIFVRMDWYVKDAFGKGTDWVVLTKLSHDSAPMMLWRK